ncbi:MAG: hypothetical protein RIB32_03815 [Phycisphaerales bacterium]
MIEILLAVGACIAIGRIAYHEDQSGIIWGLITAAICLGSLALIPIPFGRVVIAAVLAFVAMTVYKIVRKE